MKNTVTWPALIFVAGIIVGTIAWTFWFWTVIDDRIEEHIETHISIYHTAR